VVSETLLQAIRDVLAGGTLPCAEAFRIAERLDITPAEVGGAADELGIRVSHCQLGLFGYGSKAEGKHRIVRPLPEVPSEISEEIESRLQEGRLPCREVWVAARRLGRTRLEVSGAAEALEVRIARCQLGCF